MNSQPSNIYQTPEACLELEAMGLKDLPRLTTWLVFLLAVFTLYLYPLYWLYQRSNIINKIFPDNKINEVFMIIVTAIWLGSFGADLVDLVYPLPYWNDSASSIVSFSVSVSIIVWGFMIRSRLHDLFNSIGIDVHLGSVMTFLFGPIYLAYKINQAKDISNL